jgi:dCTP deaminase
MSVIALTITGPEPLVVTSNDAFRREGAAILIQNNDPGQLISNEECNATYDLRVGQLYTDHRSFDSQELRTCEEIKLLSGNAVIIETEKFIAFPKQRFGQILPKVLLLQQGIANTPSRLDPGYAGYLLITAFNHGKQTVSLRRGQRFCSLHVLDVEGPVRPYDKPGKRITGAHRSASWRRRARDWIDANVATVVVIQTVIALVSVGLATLSYLSRR